MLRVRSLLCPAGECMKNRTKLACLAVLGFATVSLWAQADGAANAAKPENTSAAEAKTAAEPGGVPPDYVIGADDTLRIAVWKEPDMNATLPVRPDGKISLPLLDDVQAAGLT